MAFTSKATKRVRNSCMTLFVFQELLGPIFAIYVFTRVPAAGDTPQLSRRRRVPAHLHAFDAQPAFAH